jgi:hypothetical protein
VTEQFDTGAGTLAEEEIPDFGRQRKRVRFKVDGEVFEAAPGLPVEQAMEFAVMADQWRAEEPEQAMRMFRELFAKVLLPESLDRLLARLSDMQRPIEVDQLPQVIEYLLGRYGMRPTEESSDSSTGSANPDGGTRPEAASPSPALISTASPSTAP